MPKRKRSDIEETIDKIEDRAVRIKASRLQVKIDHGSKSLKTALSLARGFERQKLGRRQKQASQEPHTLLRLREEVIVLKELDVSKTASEHLFKQLVRTKRIRESAAFIALYGDNPKTEAPKSNAEANVLGRLFKANPVKEILPGVVDDIKQVLGLNDSQMVTNGAHRTATSTRARGDPVNDNNLHTPVDEDDFGGFSDGSLHENGDVTISSDDDLDEAELAAYENRLASSSDENGDVREEELDRMEFSHNKNQNPHERISISPASVSLSEEETALPSRQKHPAPHVKLDSASFLPSLTMGGYYSGSESGEDDTDQQRGPALPKERKNRRGQRERQKLAELKFGKNAKHLQKPQKTNNGDRGRGSGWDAKRGAVGASGYDPKQRRFRKGGFSRDKGPTGANGEELVGDRTAKKAKPASALTKSDGPLHPSWEAARKKKLETGKIAFAGNKITFD